MINDPLDGRFNCTDCGMLVHSKIGIGEYYMVAHELWAKFCSDAYMLCVGCVEDRMGRPLVRSDFFRCPASSLLSGRRRSNRLLGAMLRHG